MYQTHFRLAIVRVPAAKNDDPLRITEAPSLVDSQGYFYPATSQRGDFPPHTGFLEAPPSPREWDHARLQGANRAVRRDYDV